MFRRFFTHLSEGDPVALTVAALLSGSMLVFGLIWWRIARNLRREDEERSRRYGGGKKKQ
jgi:hypothetical protein